MAKKTPRNEPVPSPPAGATQPPARQYMKILVDPKMHKFLESRGARPDRGGSRWNRAAIIREQFELFITSLDESDPRKRGFPQEFYSILIELLTEPWTINGSMIKILDSYIATLPLLNSYLEPAKIDRKAFLEAITQLTFAERLHLVEEAHVRHAPRPEPGSPEL